ETFRWTVVQQIEPGAAAAAAPGRKTGKKPPKSSSFSNFKSIIVLQKSYECSECGKSFSCSSHFSKHRRTHTG
ncbi:ZN799 protein, partial [Nicator chloris]|nr:ZN799 protein [Nicator chloris]